MIPRKGSVSSSFCCCRACKTYVRQCVDVGLKDDAGATAIMGLDDSGRGGGSQAAKKDWGGFRRDRKELWMPVETWLVGIER